MEVGQEVRQYTLRTHEIEPKVGQWFKQQAWLDAFKDSTHELGKILPRKKITEGIGHYQLTEFNKENRHTPMVCNTPYPSKFDEGVITQIVRNFRPTGSIIQQVELDTSQESRKNGAESCTYSINW